MIVAKPATFSRGLFTTTNPITITGLCTAVAVAVWSRNMAATVIVSMLVYAGLNNWL